VYTQLYISIVIFIYTGRFIMFSVITNIYNKKSKGPTVMELFTATGKLRKFFDNHGWHGTHRYDIQVLATHASAWVHRYSSQLQWSVPYLYHAPIVLSFDGSFAYFARNARCTVTTDLLVWYSNTQNDFFPGAAIFSLYTPASPSGRNVNYDEKQLTGKKWSCSFYLYSLRKYVFYDFPIINFCNPGQHYETPCIYTQIILWQP